MRAGETVCRTHLQVCCQCVGRAPGASALYSLWSFQSTCTNTNNCMARIYYHSNGTLQLPAERVTKAARIQSTTFGCTYNLFCGQHHGLCVWLYTHELLNVVSKIIMNAVDYNRTYSITIVIQSGNIPFPPHTKYEHTILSYRMQRK